MPKAFTFTSESVSEGHPDKVADQISDAVLDEALRQDPESRVACETTVTTQCAQVIGEITTSAQLDFDSIIRDVIADIGYTEPGIGFDYRNVETSSRIGQQSRDIARGVDRGAKLDQGAGDQGIVFGYAKNDTPELMPAPIAYAHRLVQTLAAKRKSGVLGWARPDSKSQVSVQYNERRRPQRIDTIVISTQHIPDITQEEIHDDIRRRLINVVCADLIDDQTKFHINPTGKFEIGGPTGDSGLTGRKIIVDTYGGMGRHGGGAFSGKDPSKVDRSAAYMARYAAKNVVAARLADECEIQIGYAIGVAKPVSAYINTFGTNAVDEDTIVQAVMKTFDFRPGAIEDILNLRNDRRPQYKDLAAYGHMGREDLGVRWEETDRVEDLLRAVKG